MAGDTSLTVEIKQAARLLGVSEANAYAAVRRGELPVLRLGPRRFVVPKAELARMLGVDPAALDEPKKEGLAISD